MKIILKNMQNENVCLKGHWKFTFRDAITGAVLRVQEFDNLIPTVARAMIANNLTDSSPTNAMRVNYVALGTGTTAPANADTKLETETYRNTVASQTNASNIAYCTGFYSATECNGSYKEAGIFSDGTAVADSGIIVSHVAIDITKSNTETLTIDWSITIS